MAKKKTTVSANLKQNLLHITLIGAISKKEMEEIFTEIRFCVADLKPGFSVINDLTQCKIAYLRGLGTFEKIREYIGAKEVGTVVRIVRKKQLIFKQLSRVMDRKSQYQSLYAASVEEAQGLLAELGQPKQSP